MGTKDDLQSDDIFSDRLSLFPERRSHAQEFNAPNFSSTLCRGTCHHSHCQDGDKFHERNRSSLSVRRDQSVGYRSTGSLRSSTDDFVAKRFGRNVGHENPFGSQQDVSTHSGFRRRIHGCRLLHVRPTFRVRARAVAPRDVSSFRDGPECLPHLHGRQRLFHQGVQL